MKVYMIELVFLYLGSLEAYIVVVRIEEHEIVVKGSRRVLFLVLDEFSFSPSRPFLSSNSQLKLWFLFLMVQQCLFSVINIAKRK